jgi:hypothetical protein
VSAPEVTATLTIFDDGVSSPATNVSWSARNVRCTGCGPVFISVTLSWPSAVAGIANDTAATISPSARRTSALLAVIDRAVHHRRCATEVKWLTDVSHPDRAPPSPARLLPVLPH